MTNIKETSLEDTYIHTRWYGNVLIDDGTSRKEYLISNFEFVTGLVDGDLTQSTLVAG